MKSFFFLFWFSHIYLLHEQDAGNPIWPDQDGFYPYAPKITVVSGLPEKNAPSPLRLALFYLIREYTFGQVFRGGLRPILQSYNFSLQNRMADFSSIIQTGTCRVFVPGPGFGGPNPAEQDPGDDDLHEPETEYMRSDGMYASNDIAISRNAPLVYLSNAIEVLQNNFRKQN
jgi:hypothetical protein